MIRIGCFVLVMLLCVRGSQADTLVCYDGRRIEGQIVKEGAVYTVKRGTIEFRIPADQVSEWIKDKGGPKAPAVTKPSAPAPQPSPPTVADTPKPAAPSKAEANAARQAEVLAQRMRLATDALAAGDFAAACAGFLDALDADSRNVRALHGLALSHAGLGELAKAALAVERAIGASRTTQGLDRALVLNHSAIMIAQKEPMKAIRVLQEYLRIHPEPMDEPMINALAVALHTTDRSARGNSQYAQAVTEYMNWNNRLEAARPGERRWGVEWVSQLEFVRRDTDWERSRLEWERLTDNVDTAAGLYDRALARYNRVRNVRVPGFGGPSYMSNAQSAMLSARSQYATALAQYRAFTPIGQPPQFPTALTAVGMDDLKPPKAEREIIVSVEASQPAGRRIRRVVPPAGVPAVPATGDEAEPLRLPEPSVPTIIVRKTEEKRSIVRNAIAIPIAPDLLLSSADAVAGAQRIRLEDLSGRSFDAEVLRADDASGLVLLRAAGQKLKFVRVADRFAGGPVQCLSFAASVFDLRTEVIAGAVRTAEGGLELSLPRLPRRTAAPLVAGNMLVGLAIGDRGVDLAEIAIIPAEQIRAFCGPDLPATDLYAAPEQVLCELTATVLAE